MRRSNPLLVLGVLLCLVFGGAALQLFAQVTSSQTSVNFGQVAVGIAAGSTKTLSFTVPSNITLGSISAVTQGAPNLDFTITGGTCSSGSSGTACTVQAQFVPTTVGARMGAVVLSDQSTPANTLIAVPVYGAGTGAMVAFGPGTITTIAGGNSSTGGTFNLPNAVGLDGAGNIYVADTYNHVVRKVAAGGGTITNYAGGNGAGFSGDGGLATSAQFYYPGPLRVDGAGNLYISDWGNNRIRMVTPAGMITTVAGGGTGCGAQQTDAVGDGCAATSAILNGPWGTVSDGAGNLYIGDSGNNLIRKVTPDGTISTIAGTGAAGYGGDGQAATAALLNGPQLGAIDAAGNLYIADTDNSVIRMLTPGGILSTVAGNFAAGPGYSGDNGPAISAQLEYPEAVAVDAAGNLYIADSGNYPSQGGGWSSVIRKVSPTGVITTVAGNGTEGYTGDNGPATSAQLYGPWDVTVDGSGNLYIVDAYNNAIRKVDVSDAPSILFPNTNYNAVSAAQYANVMNFGNTALTINSINTSANFALGGTQASCNSSSQALNPAVSCVLGIDFAPQATGTISGSVILADNAVNGTGGAQTIALSGVANPASQSITFTGPGPQTYGVSPITLTASATSSLPVGFSLVSGPASLSGSTLTITGAGSVTVQATQAGNADYATATPVNVTFSVAQAQPTVNTWPSASAITYGQTLASSSLTGGSSTPSGGSFAFTVSGTSPTAGASAQSVTYTPADSTDYANVIGSVNVTVYKATPTITAAPTASSIIYGQSLASSNLTGGSASANGGFAFTTPATKPAVGTSSQSVTFTPADPTDYGTASGSVNVTVGKATLTATANNLARNINTANPTLTYTVTGYVNGDGSSVVSGAASCSTTATTSSPTGNYPITCTVGTLSAQNYTFTMVAGTMYVAPGITESNVSVSQAMPVTAGSVITVSDTATNNGVATAAGTVMFYFSTTTSASGGVYANRSTGQLAVNASTTGSTNITVPSNLTGSYYVVACVATCSSTPITIVQPPPAVLTESNVSVSQSMPVTAGTVITVSDKVTNTGGSAGVGTVLFYFSTTTSASGGVYANRSAGSLAVGASSSGSTNITVPSNLTGSYYVVACVTTCSSTPITIVQPPPAVLTESNVSVSQSMPVAAGSVITVSDKVTNTGGSTGAGTVLFYFSTTTSASGGVYANRSTGSLAVGASSSGSTNITVPSNLKGSYYVVACATTCSSTPITTH